jgi:hypothetical protein
MNSKLTKRPLQITYVHLMDLFKTTLDEIKAHIKLLISLTFCGGIFKTM